MMKSHRASLVVLLLAFCAPALGDDLNQLQTLSQREFRSLAEDLGAALSYKPLAPTAPLGAGGFDIGVGVTATRLKHSDLFARATSDGDFPTTIAVPSIRAAVGLPHGFDLSGMYSSIPKTSLKLYGGALKYALVPGNTALPALGLRATYTRMKGVDQLGFSTASFDGSVSKGFGAVTPYIGAGRVWADAAPLGATGLRSESFWLNKVFVGLDFKVSVVSLAFEYDRTGGANSYGAKLGFRF